METEFLRVFANDSDVGLVTIQFVNMTMMSNKSNLTKMGWKGPSMRSDVPRGGSCYSSSVIVLNDGIRPRLNC